MEEKKQSIKELRERALFEHDQRSEEIHHWTEKNGGEHHRVNRYATDVSAKTVSELIDTIRKELEIGGYHFQSQTDTEVILAAYEKWGNGCVHKFNGMWAFVIYDRRRNVIFASRDRSGVKPLYYFYNKEKEIL